MAEAVDQVGAAVPLFAALRVGLVFAALEKQRVPAGHQWALVEREAHLIGRGRLVYRRLRHQVGVQGLHVGVSDVAK
ncbi:hypothetical protein D3C79_646260 [compost metagenome]